MPTTQQKGFTLLELLVTMVIIVAIAGIAVPQLSRSLTHVQLGKNTREIAALLRNARDAAMSESRTIDLVLNDEDRSLEITDSDIAYRWSAEVNVELLATVAAKPASVERIQFFPDGTATNSSLRVSAGSRGHEISVDWLTGRVKVY